MASDEDRFRQIIRQMEKNDVAAQTVDLTLMELTTRNLRALNEALKRTKVTKILKLNSNELTDYKISLIIEGLSTNDGLENLNLKDNEIDNNGATAIRKAILDNPNIKDRNFVLDLSINHIDLKTFTMSDELNRKFATLNLKLNFKNGNSSTGKMHDYMPSYTATVGSSSKRRWDEYSDDNTNYTISAAIPVITGVIIATAAIPSRKRMKVS